MKKPEEITSNCLFWSVPAHPNFPEDLQGIPVVIPATIHIGDPEKADDLMQPHQNLGDPALNLSGHLPYVNLQTAFDSLFTKGERQNYWKSLYLDTLDENAIDKIVKRAHNRPDP